MPGGSISTIQEKASSYLSERKSDVYLIELGPDDRPVTRFGAPQTLAFQYFPDTISDTKAVNYQQKEIPGGSLPLYQWMNGGERLLSFTAFFSTDVDLIEGARQKPGALATLRGSGGNIVDRLKNAGEARRNVDIRAAVAWLRRYMFPSYVSADSRIEGTQLTYAPPKVLLVIPNSGIGVAGGDTEFTSSPDSVISVMTQCDVTYEAFFPSGLPRIASIALSFAQVPQYGGFIQFPQRGTRMDEALDPPGSPGATLGYFGYTLGAKTKNGGT